MHTGSKQPLDRDGDGTVTVEEEFVVFYYDVRSGNAMPFHKKYLAFKQWWNSIKIQTL